MKRIVFIPCGVLPLPAVRGGAVENLVQLLLQQNESNKKYQFIVYSSYDRNAEIVSKQYKYTTFKYISINKILTGCFRLLGVVESKVLSYTFKNYFLYKIIRDLKKYESIDVIILENAPKYAIELKKHFPYIKILQHYHNIPEEQLIWKHVDSNLDGYLCISHFIKEQVDQIFHLNATQNKAKVFYNCADIDRFGKISLEKRMLLRHKLGLKDNDIVVIYTGRIQPYKGVKQLLEGFSNLSDENVRLLIVGGSFYGDTKKNEFMQELEQIAKKLGDKILFTGYISYDDIPDYYGIADIAVVPSLWQEPFALSVLEALASKLPVIATRQGGIPEVVDKDCAILIDADKNIADSIALALRKIIDDKSLCMKMSESAQKRAMKFTKESYWNNFIKIID